MVAAGTAVASSNVTLYAGGATPAPPPWLGDDERRRAVRDHLPRPRPGPSVLYAIADGGDTPAARALRFMAVADPGRGRRAG